MNSCITEAAKNFSAALMAAVTALFTHQASAGELLALTPDDKFVIAATLDDMGSLDPAEAFEFSTSDLLNNLYDTLLIEDANAPGLFLPSLAKEWEISREGRMFSFSIRPDVVFESGASMSAADAAFSLRRLIILDAAPASILTSLGMSSENVDAQIYYHDTTLVIELPEPVAPEVLLSALSTTATSILDQKTVLENEVSEDWGNMWLSEHTAGTGSYKLYSLSREIDYVLEARPNHWRGEASLSRVRVHHVPDSETQKLLLEMGLIDVARNIQPSDMAALAENGDIYINSHLTGEIQYLAANMAHPVLSNSAVIEAMRWLIDYDAIAATPELAGSRIVHHSFLPRGAPSALEDTPFKFDPEHARAILSAAQIEPFSATLLVRDVEDRVQIARKIRDSFAAGGIDISLEIESGGEVLEQYRARRHDLILEAWIPEYTDPHFNASSFAANRDNSATVNNTGSLAWRNNFHSDALNILVENAFVAQDPDVRMEIYHELQRVHRKSAPFAILFQKVEQTAVLAHVSGFSTGSITRRASYRDVVKSFDAP